MGKIAFKRASAFTLVEMVIVVAVIAALSVVVIATASRIQSKAKEELTADTISLLTAALAEFQNYDYDYQGQYTAFEFPLDCNDFIQTDTESVLEEALGATNVAISGYDPNNSGSEMWYFMLSRVPECKSILDKIDNSLKEDTGIVITVDSRGYQLFRIIDTWDNALRYDYYEEDPPPFGSNDFEDMEDSRRAFPVITSAGPDKQFDTRDDIVSR